MEVEAKLMNIMGRLLTMEAFTAVERLRNKRYLEMFPDDAIEDALGRRPNWYHLPDQHITAFYDMYPDPRHFEPDIEDTP